ncbi:MAG: YkgJ family cysteine cluster protein [Xanthobacteraceae bacterium]
MNDCADEAELSSASCQSCGACCSFSAEWPRFSLESEADIGRIPSALVDDARGRMRCDGDRCAALVGEVGVAASCAIYDRRPDVCKACMPGDDACRTARRHFGIYAPPSMA